MSKYKGENGVLLTRGLFYEWNNPDAPFSLRDTGEEEYYVARSGKKYQSFPYLFRKYDDEYEFAIAVLGSWEHWKKLKSLDNSWFLTGEANGTQYTGLNDWLEEQQRKEEMLAKKVLLKKIEDEDGQAAKFLYTERTKPKAGSKGRPAKKEPPKTKSKLTSIVAELEKRKQG